MTAIHRDTEHMSAAPTVRTHGRLFWFCFVVTAASALTSLGFSIAALPGGGAIAQYATGRSLALALAALSMAALRHRVAMVLVALLMTVVQGLDAVVGIGIGDLVKTAGPAFLAALTLVAAVLLARRPDAASA